MAKKDYTNWDRNDLIKEIEQLRKRKKYGLVWEDKPENVVEQCKTELPVLEEVKSKEIITDPEKPINLLIEGDNYHALSVLNYTHKGKIDVIYIDPPYNTGAKDWKYNNDYVDNNDMFRHSKWISMMNNRLKLAKKLLKRDGVLICAIDDNEQAHLGVLLEELFHGFEIHCITIIHNPGGVQGKNFSYNHEYAYFIFPKGFKKIGLQNREDNPDTRPLRDVSTGDHLRTAAKNCFYPIYVKNDKIIGFGEVCKDDFHPESANILRKDGVLEIYPIDPSGNERKWVFARQSVESIKDELTIEYNKRRKIYDVIRKKTRFNYKTVWDNKLYNANLFGTQLLSKIISTKFPFPKSLFAVKECISATIHKNNSIILDYFAGSGTTAHAVLDLNKEDGGNRKFILCTNNELNGEEKELREKGLTEKEIQSHGICQAVTYPRVKKVIEGYADVDGVSANLKYYKTAFVPADLTDKNKIALTEKATEMLCVKEDTFEEVKSTKQYKIFRNKKRYTGIVFDHQAIDDFKKEIAKIDGKFSLYIFSLGDDTFDEEFEDMKKKVKLSPIPEAILRVYRRIFK
ncbi:MAG: site-specific DNA-methyltransferase [Spirochaetota bacterium]|nr:site-specific DNA-methyltransferase [Spirochaetota bacterium]